MLFCIISTILVWFNVIKEPIYLGILSITLILNMFSFFARNFKKEAAMYAGLKNSTGDYVIVMDADLQHPPTMIPDMLRATEEGYDCCAARRTSRTAVYQSSPVRSLTR